MPENLRTNRDASPLNILKLPYKNVWNFFLNIYPSVQDWLRSEHDCSAIISIDKTVDTKISGHAISGLYQIGADFFVRVTKAAKKMIFQIFHLLIFGPCKRSFVAVGQHKFHLHIIAVGHRTFLDVKQIDG